MQPFFFGRSDRALLGIHHPAACLGRQAWLVCAPLMQDGVRCQRALWTLARGLAAGNGDVLRFDWFGSGDSDGTTREMNLHSLAEDMLVSCVALEQLVPGAPQRLLALRSAALPVLVHAAAQGRPVDVVLWEPTFDGAGLVANWHRQHDEQLRGVGRYSRSKPHSEPGELTGFDVDPDFVDALSRLDQRSLVLPVGSRVLVASWTQDADTATFIAAQRAAGLTVETLALDPADRPAFDVPRLFEAQAFPRRSVAQLVKRLQGGGLA